MSSDWIPVAAVVVGGLLALLGSWATSGLQARREHRGRLLDTRIEAYTNLLDLAWAMRDLVEMRALGPFPAGRDEPDAAALRRADVAARLVGTRTVRDRTDALTKALVAFNQSASYAKTVIDDDGTRRYSPDVDLGREYQAVADAVRSLEEAMASDLQQSR